MSLGGEYGQASLPTSWLHRHGRIKVKCDATRRVWRDPNLSTGSFDDRFTHCQPNSFALWFGCVVASEHIGKPVFRNANSGVLDGNLVVVNVKSFHLNPQPLWA